MGYGERQVPCTRCPLPCDRCRRNGTGAYCADTPCACECHGEASVGGGGAKYSGASEAFEQRQRAALLATERAKTKRLYEALLTMTPEVGFPECTKECRSQHFAPDEQPECCCGFEEIRFYAQNARAVLEELKP